MASKKATKKAAGKKAAGKKAAKLHALDGPGSRFLETYDVRFEKYLALMAKNTPASVQMASRVLDKILATNENDILALAEKGYVLIHQWRNGSVDAGKLTECSNEFGTNDVFACASAWAQKAIDTAKANKINSPYGDWALAYALKYRGKPDLSAFHYGLALSRPPKAFLDLKARRRKHLVAEWVEAQVYWQKKADLSDLLDAINQDPADGSEDDKWMNWVRCFILHLLEDYQGSIGLYGDLPNDADTSLIMAANFARLGSEADRKNHRNRFRNKSGNANWTADMEDVRSPFVDPTLKKFWFNSVKQALK